MTMMLLLLMLLLLLRMMNGGYLLFFYLGYGTLYCFMCDDDDVYRWRMSNRLRQGYNLHALAYRHPRRVLK